jgi:hypothetical protein
MLKTISTRQSCFQTVFQYYSSRNQRISCFYKVVVGTMAMIVFGMVLLVIVLNRPVNSSEVPWFVDKSIKVNSLSPSPKKNAPHHQVLDDTQRKINWQHNIHRFLTRVSPHFRNRSICANRWGVAVDVTESVLDTAKRLSNWCIVVVIGDQQYIEKDGGNIFYLNKTVRYQLAKISAFYKESLLLPNDLYTVLKNLGYLWAIFHQATIIWDFDTIDRAVLNTSALELSLNEKIEALNILNHNRTLFNPYLFFMLEWRRVWSRGYPLRYIAASYSSLFFPYSQRTIIILF